MENNESSNSINEDKDKLTRKFLKIKNVKVFSNAYNLRLKENDIILGLDGEFFNSSHDDLKKALDEDEEDKKDTKRVRKYISLLFIALWWYNLLS